MNASGPGNARGFSLIELSLAAGIYSLGLGSLSLLMLLAIRGTADANLETTATLHAASLAEAIMLTSDAAGHYALPLTAGIESCEFPENCGPEQMAEWQLAAWRERIAADLPGGEGLICADSAPDDGDTLDPACDGSGSKVVKILWNAPGDTTDGDHHGARQVMPLPLPR